MKTIITKEFTDEDDEGMAKVFTQSLDYYLALGEIANEFRTTLKYNVRYDEKEMKVVEDMSEKFYTILGEFGISLDTLQ